MDWVDKPKNSKDLSGAHHPGFVWNFVTFSRLPFEQFSAENS